MPRPPNLPARVVIGANYGDEGKGLVTDALVAAAPGPAVVIRYNSSAQAGHTVVTPDGRRHVFHHVGSGAFAGADTLLSRFFVSHPMLLPGELEALAGLGIQPQLWVDERSQVALPFDVLINQITEDHRGRRRHGSCGIGFGEAIERSLRPRFAVSALDLIRPSRLRERLRAIRDDWLPRRLAVLGVPMPTADETLELLTGDALIDRFLLDAEAYLDRVHLLKPGSLPMAESLVFEGAQGLALDQDAPDFPHVTRSKTGLANVVTLAQETDLETLDVLYVTRCYLTRHGAGPLPYAYDTKPYVGITDATNVPNAYQGALRFADLDLSALARRVDADLAGVRADGLRVSAGLALTCLDQPGDHLAIRDDGQETIPTEALAERLHAATGLRVTLCAYGPHRQTVVWQKP